MVQKRITAYITDEEGYDVEVEMHLPAKMVVCYRCNGKGVHDHPAFSNGITGDEMAEAGLEFQEDYLSGMYDVVCSVCKGQNVVPEVLEDQLNDEQREAWKTHCEYQNELAMEQRMRERGIEF